MQGENQTLPELNCLAEGLACAIVMASHEDPQGLAAIHTQLQQLCRALPVEAGPESIAHQSASNAEKLVEQIILGEVDDAAAAVVKLNRIVTELIAAVSSPAGEDAQSNSAGGNAAAAASPAANADDQWSTSQASTFNPADLSMLGEFITESSGHIDQAEAALLQLESDPANVDAVNGMFRNFHTIKGVAGFLNIKPIGALAHAAENLLDLARHGNLRISGPVVDLILETIDLLKEMIAGLQETAKSGAPILAPDRLAPLVKRLAECAAGKGEEAAAAPLPKAQPVPAQEAQAPAKPPATPAAADWNLPAPTPAAPTVVHPTPSAAPEHKAESTRAADASKPSANAQSSESVVKVSTDRLDTLVNAIGELVIAQSMIRQDFAELLAGNHRAAKNLNHMSKIARELQDISMSMRMVPINGVFQKMSRLVRDLSRKSEKEIELVLLGGETELDRGLVEAISDPLVHMVRNAADHGIEAPDVREKAGKPRGGRIEIKAFQQAGYIVIAISDDGKGLAKARILKKAIEAGIVKPDEQLTEQEIFKLIFHAGLSTAEKVTDVSGRGVGMDVVRKNVESLRGRIDITSVEGRGSTFTIRLPLTLAVIDGLVIKAGGQRYVVPITSVEQTIQPTQDQLSTVNGRGELCTVRGSLLPLYRLSNLLGLPRRSQDPTQSLVVIVHDNDRRCCLLVDDLVGQQQVVIKSLGEMLGRVPGVSGGAILGDGQVSLIIDVSGLMDAAIQCGRQ